MHQIHFMGRRFTHKIVLVLVILGYSITTLAQSDSKPKDGIIFSASGYKFPYKLSKPDKKIILPNVLLEISGLSWIGNDQLACIQDEDGVIFIYDLRKEAIADQYEFGEDGDYEGIEIIGDDAWVLKSNGNLYRVSYFFVDLSDSCIQFETL